MPAISDDLRLSMAKDITAAYVNNKTAAPNPEQAVAMLKAIHAAIGELAADTTAKHKVGLG